jgi:sterol desaturase/sphingolipid hydroxylase (fatty acid hydroxylase superfamily)
MLLDALQLILRGVISVADSRLIQFWWVAIVFIPLERLIPFHPRQRLFRRLILLDLFHYFVGGVFIVIFVGFTSRLITSAVGTGHLYVPFASSFSRLPWYWQLLIWEAGWTGLGYWLHRVAHVWLPLWRMHVVHESSKELDWLSAFRLHPLEPALFQVLTIVPLLLLGVQHPAVTGYAIWSYVFAHVQHANVLFPIGPLKYILPTPEFHRWHHARVRDAGGNDVLNLCNFGQYPFWDLIFGTFYLPSERPIEYGSADGDKVPAGYIAQVAYPFGLHESWLAVLSAAGGRFRTVLERFARFGVAVAPLHNACEDQLARLCLLRTTVQAAPPMMNMGPALKGEKT